jgi:hypothetical protein
MMELGEFPEPYNVLELVGGSEMRTEVEGLALD